MSQLIFEHRTSGTVVSTINFQTDGHVMAYVPSASEKETVTESAKLLLEEDTAADLQTKIRSIETMLDIAKKHPNGPEGVWVLYSPDTGTAWQSRLVNGALLFDKNTEFLWSSFKKIVDMVIERQNYWEEEDATTLELSNGSVTDSEFAPINNDPASNIYAMIAADQLGGVLSTPAILEFEHNESDASLIDDLLVGVIHGDGNSTLPTPSSLVVQGSGSADATCSGGEYAELTWADDAENQLETWTIDSGDFLQKRYRAVARLQASVAYTDLYLQARLLVGTTEIARTRWMLVDDGVEMVIIGSLKIPPYDLGEAIDLGNITLALYEKRASGSGSINLDYIMLMPQDAWRRYGAIGGLANGETLIDDPVRDILVTDDGAGGYKVTNKIEEGKPLMLRPGVINYLYFLRQDTDGDAPITRSDLVVIKAHARRLTV